MNYDELLFFSLINLIYEDITNHTINFNAQKCIDEEEAAMEVARLMQQKVIVKANTTYICT